MPITRKGTITAISASAWARFLRKGECVLIIPWSSERLQSPLPGSEPHSKAK
jgi:hypothetical protein